MGIDTVIGSGRRRTSSSPAASPTATSSNVEINLGDGANDVTVEATGARSRSRDQGLSGFRTWTVIRTDRGVDTVTLSLNDETLDLITDGMLTSIPSDGGTKIIELRRDPFGADDSLAGKLL